MIILELIDVTKEIHESGIRLANGSKELFPLAKKKAETEQAYRKALAIEIMRLRDEKYQITLIPDIARGNTSDLKFERDLAEARWTSARDSLEAIRSQLMGLQSILKRQDDI